MLFQGILIECFQKINQERTTSSVYNLLIGKKAIQTIQDARFYHIADYYGIYPDLTKTDYYQQLQQLLERNYLLADDEQRLQLTKKGQEWLTANKTTLAGFYGSTYKNMIESFKQRFLLFIQTFTNIAKNEYRFIPITDNHEIEQFVKGFYKQYKHRSMVLLQQLYKELEHALSMVSDLEASMFVDRLTSFSSYGSSLQQLSQDYQQSIPDCYLTLQKVFYHLLYVQEHGEEYSMLKLFAKDLGTTADTPLSQTAQFTRRLLKKQHTFEEIIQIRRLKANTILDHFVEIAMHEEAFPFFDYLDSTIYEEIKEVVHKKQTYRLKEIKNNVHPDISYFQIRLALVLYNK
ncbi:helix-turn-helix domain-containing protein [Oceanobacillus oncorhynchi]|uniref:helix-turn-helix domain-containing protein n=1 Tax=Oceanobacillus oncorhynchi TaxID=545501 RepID=UPI0025A3A3FD|nr:helix-turn-helix domain-containing protein [Oceanobacillus oncorhynchi]MDM8101628.1 helix-turn-helix domain-containing protein [Oceanobacillus oncorhynchi]